MSTQDTIQLEEMIKNSSQQQRSIVRIMTRSCSKIYHIEDDAKFQKKTPPVFERKGGLSTHSTLINFLKGMIGPGCFSLPLALKNAGLWGGFALIFFFGMITCLCMHKLVKCSQYLSRLNGDVALDYGSVAREAMRASHPIFRPHGNKAKHFVNFCLLLLQVGVCAVWYIFVIDHLKEILDVVWKGNGLSIPVLMVLGIPAFILLTSVRGLKLMTYISVFGNILMIVSLVIILEALASSDHIINELPAVTDFNGIIVAAGSILYSYEGQAMVLPMENKLKYPVEMGGYTGILSTTLSLVTIVYASCGFFGYITYGKDVEGSITLNMPDTPLNFAVKIMLTLVVFTGFLVQHYVVVEMMMPAIRKQLKRRDCGSRSVLLTEYLLRYLIVIVAVGLAMGIPNLEEIIPLIGVTVGMVLALVVPPILEWLTFVPIYLEEGKRWKIVQISIPNAMYVALGIMFMIMGTKDNLQALF